MLASVHEDLAVRVNRSLIEDEHVGWVERVVLHEARRIGSDTRRTRRQTPVRGIVLVPRFAVLKERLRPGQEGKRFAFRQSGGDIASRSAANLT